MLPLSLVANVTYPYDEKLAIARGFLESRNIRDPRPIRRSLPRSEAYEAWLVRSRPKLRVVRQTNAR